MRYDYKAKARRNKERREQDVRLMRERMESAQKCPSVGRTFVFLPGHGNCIQDSLTGYYWKAIEGQINKWQRVVIE